MHAIKVHDDVGQSPDSLILEGYRRWCTWHVTKDDAQWEIARNRFVNFFGSREGLYVIALLSELNNKICACARCPLNRRPINCNALCLHEVLILGLISGIQHDDETAVTLCMDELVSQARFEEVYYAAQILATILQSLERTLFPVPAETIRHMLTQNVSSSTLQ